MSKIILKFDHCLEQIFVLSTCHLTKADAKAMDEPDLNYNVAIHKYDEYGWIVIMPENVAEAQVSNNRVFSDAFWYVLQYVKLNYPNCPRVQFDKDGIVKNDFLKFNW